MYKHTITGLPTSIASLQETMNSTKVQNPRRCGGAQVHKGCSSDIRSTRQHEERAPIIDGLGRAPPHPRAAGHLITVNNSIS